MGADFSQGRILAGQFSPQQPSFEQYLGLLQIFLSRRDRVVECIETMLHSERKPDAYLQDRALLNHHLEACFLQGASAGANEAQLAGQLEAAYCAQGFQPRILPGLHNDLVHPAEMMIRAFHLWRQTRWPGRSRRMRYAHTLFNVYLLRTLELLSMRLWDGNPSAAPQRLAELQSLLDVLWHTSPADQPRFVRDARWLIPLAQSLPTDEVAVYLEVARLVADTLHHADALEVQRAQVRMLGGHLTSQIRHYCTRDAVPIHHQSVVLRTRTSNALDFALLVQGLAALMQAYEAAILSGDEPARLQFAGTIFQGISADPDLFLNHTGLLSAYSRMEHVIITTEGTAAAYSPLGERHERLLAAYRRLVERLIEPLRADLPHFRPTPGSFSPLGVVFGTPSTLIELMALKAFEPDAEIRFGLEDVFTDSLDDAETAAAKLAWVNGWRRLPHIPAEVQRSYEYPQSFAEEIYQRITAALQLTESIGKRTGRLHVSSAQVESIPPLAAKYFRSSDDQLIAAQKAEPMDQAQLLHGRQEGHFLVSYATPGGWMALRKDALDEVLAQGHDAAVTGLPPKAAQVLRLMCPDLVAPE